MRVVLVVLGVLIIVVVVGGVMFTRFTKHGSEREKSSIEEINLPEPVFSSLISVEEALGKRKSVRAYHDEPLSTSDVSQLLWAAQGITRPGGYRTAPSAGALYPLEVYLLAGDVTGLDSGLYRYEPESHVLQKTKEGDYRDELSQAALNQEAIRDAPAIIIITGIYERTTGKYGGRGRQYVHMEVGSVSQNIYLQAVSLNLGTVFIGAFYDGEVQKVLGLGENEVPFSIMPVGHPEAE
jgi:SagB-type dehydrogenase family enzyme